MESSSVGSASAPKRIRTRQQWHNRYLEIIEMNKRSNKRGNLPQSSSDTCSATAKPSQTSGMKRKERPTPKTHEPARKKPSLQCCKDDDSSDEETGNATGVVVVGETMANGEFRSDMCEVMSSTSSKCTKVGVSVAQKTDDSDEESESQGFEPVLLEDSDEASQSQGCQPPVLEDSDVASQSQGCQPPVLEDSNYVFDLSQLGDLPDSSESESEATSDEDNDHSSDADFCLKVSSRSSKSDDVATDSDADCIGRADDDQSCQQMIEEGNSSQRVAERGSNEGQVPQPVVDGEKATGRSYFFRSRSLMRKKHITNKKKLSLGDCSTPILVESESSSEEESESGKSESSSEEELNVANKSPRKKNQKKNVSPGGCSSPVILKSGESDSSSEEESESGMQVQNISLKGRRKMPQRKSNIKGLDFVKFIVNSIINEFDDGVASLEGKDSQPPIKESLPLKFRFEDEDPIPTPPKEDWEIQVDRLWTELDMAVLHSSIGCTNPSKGESSNVTSTEFGRCINGNQHLPVIDDQIGLICKICSRVFMEIKDIFPSLAKRTSRGHGRKYSREFSLFSDLEKFRLDNSSQFHSSAVSQEGTVWELVPDITRATMYPHQREGFEFMWRNIAGDTSLEKLKEPLSPLGGCIIAHPPGTGKTRLTLVFLQAYLKRFPECRPVIIAPPKLLPNWEAELENWKVDIPFHNLNKEEFTGQEDEVSMNVYRRVHRSAGEKLKQLYIRMVKLKSWASSPSILGISYTLFEQLTKEKEDRSSKEIRKILLTYPGLLVLEEGHIARSNKSLMWKALKKVETQKRILLSGTIFQNNCEELYNTVCVVNAKFAEGLEQKWASVSSSIDKNLQTVIELRDMIAPLTHICGENVKTDGLPGIKTTLVYLKPTDLQERLLERMPVNLSVQHEHVLSLISVHPCLVAKKKEFSDLGIHPRNGKDLNPDDGVKLKFAVELCRFCDALGERVIIFSQLLDPLHLIEEQLTCLFHWRKGREIVYVDGQIDIKQRQASIQSLNDPKSDVKVLLASTKACSEGITLIGASRVVMLDVLWNPSVEGQAISRAYRNGQTKIVHVYHLLASKWELDKIEMQSRKKVQSDILMHKEKSKISPACSLAEDVLLDTFLRHERLHHIFDRPPHPCDDML